MLKNENVEIITEMDAFEVFYYIKKNGIKNARFLKSFIDEDTGDRRVSGIIVKDGVISVKKNKPGLLYPVEFKVNQNIDPDHKFGHMVINLDYTNSEIKNIYSHMRSLSLNTSVNELIEKIEKDGMSKEDIIDIHLFDDKRNLIKIYSKEEYTMVEDTF